MKNLFETKATLQEQSKYVFISVKENEALITQLDNEGVFQDAIQLQLEDSQFALDKLEFQKITKIMKEPTIAFSQDKKELIFKEGKTKIALKVFYDQASIEHMIPAMIVEELPKELITSFKFAKQFAAENDKRLALNYVYVDNDKVYGTDGFRAYKGLLSGSMKCQVMLPKETFTIFPDASSFGYNKVSGFILSNGKGKLAKLKTMDGDYPDMEKLFAKFENNSYKVEFDHFELQKAINDINKIGGQEVYLKNGLVEIKKSDVVQIDYSSNVMLDIKDTLLFNSKMLSEGIFGGELFVSGNVAVIFKNTQQTRLIIGKRQN